MICYLASAVSPDRQQQWRGGNGALLWLHNTVTTPGRLYILHLTLQGTVYPPRPASPVITASDVGHGPWSRCGAGLWCSLIIPNQAARLLSRLQYPGHSPLTTWTWSQRHSVLNNIWRIVDSYMRKVLLTRHLYWPPSTAAARCSSSAW